MKFRFYLTYKFFFVFYFLLMFSFGTNQKAQLLHQRQRRESLNSSNSRLFFITPGSIRSNASTDILFWY